MGSGGGLGVSKYPVNLRGMIDGDISMLGVQQQRDTSDTQSGVSNKPNLDLVIRLG